jgi:hypothetical protein
MPHLKAWIGTFDGTTNSFSIAFLNNFLIWSFDTMHELMRIKLFIGSRQS